MSINGTFAGFCFTEFLIVINRFFYVVATLHLYSAHTFSCSENSFPLTLS